jgi:hypothetical protein
VTDHTLETSIDNLDMCLYLGRNDGEYWVAVPKQDLEAVIEFANIKMIEENK